MSRRSPNVTTATDDAPAPVAPPFDTGGSTAVDEFIQRHPYLAPVLRDLRREVDVRFGPWVPVRLEVVTDPEEGDSACTRASRRCFRSRKPCNGWILSSKPGGSVASRAHAICIRLDVRRA